jgi:hypothetical protein
MKLRSILIILSLLVCLSTLVGGYIYLSSVHQSILKRAENDSTLWTKHIQSIASTHMRNQRNVVKAFAGLKELTDLEKHIMGYAFGAALETLGRIAQALA